jgi:hypothetical protein
MPYEMKITSLNPPLPLPLCEHVKKKEKKKKERENAQQKKSHVFCCDVEYCDAMGKV